MTLIVFSLFALTVHEAAAAANKLKHFATDYCTMFLDGPSDRPELWKHCCLEHDVRYWFGGSQADMDVTDVRLKSCVKKVAGENWADLIYIGVRAGHNSPVKNKFQWNWGWETKRPMQPLSSEEKSYVISELKKLNLQNFNMDEFLRLNFPLTK